MSLFTADTGDGQPSLAVEGLLFSLLGAADSATLHRWFAELSEGEAVVDPLRLREGGAHDGRVRDRFGLTWLIDHEGS